jgi:hypothetical protein
LPLQNSNDTTTAKDLIATRVTGKSFPLHSLARPILCPDKSAVSKKWTDNPLWMLAGEYQLSQLLGPILPDLTVPTYPIKKCKFLTPLKLCVVPLILWIRSIRIGRPDDLCLATNTTLKYKNMSYRWLDLQVFTVHWIKWICTNLHIDLI